MKIMANITNTETDMERFSDGEDIKEFCRAHGLSGLELLPVDGNTLSKIPEGAAIGLHLSYYNCWVDFWNGNEQGILAEFGTMEEAGRVFGSGRQAMIDRYRAQLDFAESIGAEYVVFHVSDVSIEETLSYKMRHGDEEVAEASLELINAILDSRPYSFYFLIENLWWPGFTMKSPGITKGLMDGIHFDRKGIMLDTGHLMHTNIYLNSQEEGIGYIRAVLDTHGALCDYIKGVHLHQSVSGSYVRELIGRPPKIRGTYYERLCEAYTHVLNIDTHRPFTGRGIRGLIEQIDPEFLTYEFMSCSREELEGYIRSQNKALFSQ